MMIRLPPPPRFTLPPPPMLSSDIINRELLFRLTCSSIRQQQYHRQITNPRLIIISCITFLIITILFTFLFMIIQFHRRRKSLFNNLQSKIPSMPVIDSNNLSNNNSRSYETISFEHSVVYIESIDTSATTYSTDPSNIICLHCHQERDYSTISPFPYYHTVDIRSS